MAEMNQAAAEADGWEWAIVEIFGHRRHAGRTREEERFGAKLLRVDVPNKGAPAEYGWTTHYYGGSSIFSFTPTDEASALKINKPYEPPGRYLAPPDEDNEPLPFLGPADGLDLGRSSDFDLGDDD